MNEIEKAKQLIEDEKNKRAKECAGKIDAILEQYNCQLRTNIHVVINGELVTAAVMPN